MSQSRKRQGSWCSFWGQAGVAALMLAVLASIGVGTRAYAQLDHIIVSPSYVELACGQCTGFSAAGFDATGNYVPITPFWSASGGTVDQSGGYCAGSMPGYFGVTASVGGVAGWATVNVHQPVPVWISVWPLNVSVEVGQGVQFYATGHDGSGNTIPITPFWYASGGTIDQSGYYHADAPGDFTVVASVSGVYGTAQVHVPGPAWITVSPSDVNLPFEQYVQFSATAYNSNGVPLPGPITFSWWATGGMIGQDGGYWGWVLGDFMVTASAYGVSGTAYVHVRVPGLAFIYVSPSDWSMSTCSGRQFEAHGSDGWGNPVSITPLWGASGGQISPSGYYSSTAAGEHFVSAYAGGVSGSTAVQVFFTATGVSVTPSEVALRPGGQVQFRAVAYDACGNSTSNGCSWSATGGTINSNGLYTGAATGDFTVTATNYNVYAGSTVFGSATVHVRFGISRCEYRSATGQFALSWPSVSGRVYDVLRATNVINPLWETVASGLPPTPPENTWLEAALGGNRATLYRVRERAP
jgi:hypothetical protein